MKRIRTFLCVFIAVLSVLGIAALAGCAEEETKYDVAIRVACSDGTTYDFPVGTDERHITIPYDGTERTFWVDKFNLPDHPRWSDEWISPSGEGANVFQINYLYISPNGDYNNDRVVCNQGDYVLTIMADSTSDLWYYRACELYITVK